MSSAASRGRYDLIVVGARVAGAATALVAARRGLRVLVVDRAPVGSDTISTHQVQLPGVALLRRWGVLEELTAAGTPAVRGVRLDVDGIVVEGRFPRHDGVDALYSPRRTLLDAALVRAARAAGAEVRDRFRVTELRWDAGRVVGVRGRDAGGHPVTETATIVVGADGKHSMVAEAVGAPVQRQRPVRTLACYTYWRGLPVERGELHQRPGRAAAVFPTDDGLTMVYVAAPVDELAAFRADVQARYLASVDRFGDLGARVRSAERPERFRLTADLPNRVRVPHGPGWALVGDAGLVMDPISAQGIGNALRDAAGTADAIADALDGDLRLRDVLAARHRRRDAALVPMFDLTDRLARLRAIGTAERRFLGALADRPAEVGRFLGVLAGTTPLGAYRSPRNLARVLGPCGAAGAGLDALRDRRAPVARSS